MNIFKSVTLLCDLRWSKQILGQQASAQMSTPPGQAKGVAYSKMDTQGGMNEVSWLNLKASCNNTP